MKTTHHFKTHTVRDGEKLSPAQPPSSPWGHPIKVFCAMSYQAAGDIGDAGDPCSPRGPGGPLVEAWRFGPGRLLMSSQRPSNSTWPPRLLIDAPDQPAWSWPAWPVWGSEVEAQSCEKLCFGWGSSQLRPHLSGAQSSRLRVSSYRCHRPASEKPRKGISIKCLTCSYAALLCEPMVFSLIDVKAGDRARHLAGHQQGFSLPFVERRFVRWRQ